MILSQHYQRETDLRRLACSILIVAVIALTALVTSIVQGAESDADSKKDLLKNEPWIGDFDKMTEKRQIRVLVTSVKHFIF